MKINSDIVGLKLNTLNTNITWRQTSNYAASISDINPIYIDDTFHNNVAHPLFPVVLSWPILENLHKAIDSPYPPEVLKTMIHYFERIEIKQLIHPGENVSVAGEIIAVLPHRAGTQIISKFVVTNQNGDLKNIEYVGGMLRGVECIDGGKGKENVPFMKQEEIVEHKDGWESSLFIRPEAPFLYDGCTNIVFGIHTSPKFAKSVGLPGIILHGTATLAYSVKELINKETNGDPSKVKVISGNFTDMVFPNTNIKVQLVKKNVKLDEKELFFVVKNHKNKNAISKGYMKVEL